MFTSFDAFPYRALILDNANHVIFTFNKEVSFFNFNLLLSIFFTTLN